VTRTAALLLFLAGAAVGEPRRDIRYAESSNRLIYAFVFGHKDTCRVIRRTGPPPFARGKAPRRRLGIEWKGLPGETILGEFSFGRTGRPLHVVVSNDGALVCAFSNRASAKPPEQDAIWTVSGISKSVRLAYDDALPSFAEPSWPKLARQLAEAKPPAPDTAPLSYAFVTEEVADGRLLVGRHSEDAAGNLSELTCFVVELGNAEAKRPEHAELIALLGNEEPLFRAGAARLLGADEDRKSIPALKKALQRTKQAAGRVTIAEAIVRCGDSVGRRSIRELLAPELGASRAAARALATLPPDSRDADALADSIGRLGGRAALYAAVALARIGSPAVRALSSSVRSREPATRIAAAEILGRIDDRKAEEMLLRMVGDTDEGVRKAAAKALTNPPRAILEENYKAFAKALQAANRTETKSAAKRLATLAMHAEIKHDAVLDALVDLTTFHPRAIVALQKLTGEKFETSDDWKRWRKARN